MEGYDASTYGDRFADVYDAWYGDDDTTATTVAAVLAAAEAVATARSDDPHGPARSRGPTRASGTGGGPTTGGDRRAGPPPRVLELGAGTGRLALPLAAAGVEVVALDASTAMLDRLAAKPGGGAVTRVVGDMAGPLPDGPFDVVLVARNTFFNLTTGAAQRACAAAVAAVLAPGGRFVVEAFVPSAGPAGSEAATPTTPSVPSDATEPPARSTIEVRRIEADRVLLYVDRHEPATGELWSSFVDIRPDGIRLRPCHVRYLAPDALDRLLADAGLRLDHRWADWDGAPFDDEAAQHVSWYRADDGSGT